MTPKRAVFLDRDGTINENRPDHVKSIEEFILLPGAVEAVRQLAQTDLLIIIVSNQSVINRGLTSAETVQSINQHLMAAIRAQRGRLDGLYICPHRPDEGCQCRKPRPGLLYQARDEHNIDLAGSYLVGDAVTDVELAEAVGCQPILVLTGRGATHARKLSDEQRRRTPIVENLEKAAEWIMQREKRRDERMNRSW